MLFQYLPALLGEKCCTSAQTSKNSIMHERGELFLGIRRAKASSIGGRRRAKRKVEFFNQNYTAFNFVGTGS